MHDSARKYMSTCTACCQRAYAACDSGWEEVSGCSRVRGHAEVRATAVKQGTVVGGAGEKSV